LAIEPGDIFVSSVCAILCSAPDRISEVLQLPENCEVRQQDGASGREHYGLRWKPAKGAEPMVKWVISSMGSVVAEAIARIRRVTNEARLVTRWYEEHPGMLYLPPELEHLREQEWLTLKELADVLFAEPVERTAPHEWCIANNVPREQSRRPNLVRFADIQKVVLGTLPPDFPVLSRETGLRYSEALFIIRRNELEVKKSPFRCIIEPVGQGFIWNRLGARDSSGQKSIFDRAGLAEPDGSAIRLTSHQFRHYLNTLAQAGGMSQLDIAKWSGRKDVRQNECYDHESTESLLARVRSAIGDDTRMFGPLAVAPRATLIPRDEFARLKVPTAHTTDFGYCIHDYVMAPCQMHRDCFNCAEQICVKGEAEKESRIHQAHTEATRLLDMAEQAMAEGEFGASEWVEHHREQLCRLTSLIEILDDSAVPKGSFIQLNSPNVPSRIEQAAEARLCYDIPKLGTVLDTNEADA
jgi:hypothetical protein